MKNNQLNLGRNRWKLGMLPLIILLAIISYGFKTNAEAPSPADGVHPSTWLDLVTPDMEQSKKFYGEVFGWTFTETTVNGIKNALIKKGSSVIGSIYEVKKAKSSIWMPGASVSETDLKSKTESLVKKGAKIAIGPVNIPGRGKQVVFEGSQGEEFSLISGNKYHDNSMRNKMDGTVMGAEFWSQDVPAAKSFYQFAFNVTLTQEDHGGKPYWSFYRGENKLAGMINNPITNQGAQWVSYFYSSDPASIATKAEKLGAYIVAAPSPQVRHGQVAVVQDPNGAIFCIHTNN